MNLNDESLNVLKLRTRSISKANLHELLAENEFVSIDTNHNIVDLVQVIGMIMKIVKIQILWF